MPCPAFPAISPKLTRRQILACGTAAALGVAGWSRPPTAHAFATPASSRLRLIGEARLPHRLQFQGTTVGGLSGIDYDPVDDLYYLISDDGSNFNPARF